PATEEPDAARRRHRGPVLRSWGPTGTLYCWPTGHKFTGKFYLNRREGYGLHLFPDGATFQCCSCLVLSFMLQLTVGCHPRTRQVNCHNGVIHRLLDMGADIDKLNCEGMSALAVCHVLYYPFQSLHTTLVESPARTQVRLNFMSDFFVEALSRTGLPQHADTQETVRKMAAMKIESVPCFSSLLFSFLPPVLFLSGHRARLSTLQLLLDRGADPNVSKVPVPVLILAIMAADAEAVQKLLLCGARTDMPLPPEKKGLYPLHVAAALPGPAGPRITELLLCAIIDTDAQACDQDEIFELDKVRGACSRTYSFVPVLESELETLTILQAVANARAPLSSDERPHLRGGGRTALHVACQRVSDYTNASKVVALLLSRRASTDLLWSGHSPLSLAIASGNDMVVEELLKGGADPNFPLGRGVGSAVCTLANINYHLCCNRPKLVLTHTHTHTHTCLSTVVRTVVCTCYVTIQDLRIANTPFHALNMLERETFKSRRHLLSMMGDLLRQTAGQRKTENMQRQLKPDGQCNAFMEGKKKIVMLCFLSKVKPSFKFCYDCGRSVSVKLTPCSRCHEVFYCSTACKLKAWEKRHKEECVRMSGGNLLPNRHNPAKTKGKSNPPPGASSPEMTPK
uniref:MYND-type domain-containing protein n=1 Tax=Scophthalmus maximus TaxID=52904 RepID=A0A8D3BC57_SCOMX